MRNALLFSAALALVIGLSVNATAAPDPGDARDGVIAAPGGDTIELQRGHSRCEWTCRRAGLNCISRAQRTCTGDLQCLRGAVNQCVENYRACRQDQCNVPADDFPLPRVPGL